MKYIVLVFPDGRILPSFSSGDISFVAACPALGS
jgi:hypothetical protein